VQFRDRTRAAWPGAAGEDDMQIRTWHPDDLNAVAAINEAAVPAMNSLPAAELRRLLEIAAAGLVAEDAGEIAGFMICLAEGADYDSLNYHWFSQRYPSFAYVDRVAVAPSARGRGVGEALYEGLIAALAGSRPVLLCEVNQDPPNPGSLRFHRRLGFRTVGRQELEDGAKTVVMLEKELTVAASRLNRAAPAPTRSPRRSAGRR